MTAKRRQTSKAVAATPSSGSSPAKRSVRSVRLRLRCVPGEDVFELDHPRCVRRRAEDMEEVLAMLKAGEIDVAVDELRWLLERCAVLLEAHKLLGELALADGDLSLGRAHLGCAYQLGLAALPPAGLRGVLPYCRPANRAFFEAGSGLARCLDRLGKSDLAAEVVGQLLALDPTDPLGVRNMLETKGP